MRTDIAWQRQVRSIPDACDHALAEYVLGYGEAHAAVVQICGALSRHGATCAVVLPPAEVLGLDEASASRSVAKLAARAADGQRALLLPADPPFAAIASAAPTPPAWVAVETLLDRAGRPLGALVAHGGPEAAREETLREMPRAAAAVGAILGQSRTFRDTARVVHRMNNLLAGVIANVEYILTLADAESAEGDLAQAARHALESARSATALLAALGESARRSNPLG